MTNQIIRCETCKGNGKIESLAIIEERVEYSIRFNFKKIKAVCSDCGGSGVKWNGDKGKI